MAFQVAARQDAMATINITPLVDVMLVLLVIFMIAAPVFSRPIALDLPGRAPPEPAPEPAAPIELRIDAAGGVSWNGDAVPRSALPAMFAAEAQRDPAAPPTLRIGVSDDADYEIVAKVLAAAKNAELRKITFVR